MDDCTSQIINLDKLPKGTHNFAYTLENSFFESIKGEALGGSLQVEISIKKREHTMVTMHTKGYVVVLCDRCLKPMNVNVDIDDDFEIRYTQGESDDDTLFVDDPQGNWDSSWRAYETVMLELLNCRVHDEAECDPEILSYINQQRDVQTVQEEATVDPRWDALKDIYNKN